MLQTVSHNGLKVLWQCFREINIKRGMVNTKRKIGDQFEVNMEPITYLERKPDGTTEEKTLENTGPGEERWAWKREGTLDLSSDQAEHLKEAYDKVLGGEGFPAEQYKGVGEAEDLLAKWAADKGEDAPAE